MKIRFIIITIVALLFLFCVGIYLFQVPLEHPSCLSDNEFADYPIDEKYAEEIKAPKMPLVIFIRDKTSKEEKFSFQINDVDPKHSRPLELHKCGVYVVKKFNYDPKKTKQDPGFRAELWKYQYNGGSNSLLLLAEKDKDGVFRVDFSYDFRVDPTEAYLTLERSYLGSPDYAIIIKDLNTKEDVFVLKYNDLINKYSAPEGVLALGHWRNDGKYFWGLIHMAAKTLAFFRIEVESWKTETFIVPEDASIVSTISESGEYIIYDNGPGWIGIHEVAQQIYDEWRKEGKKVDFYVYSLFTKEKTLLATTDDPSWSFKPQWLSDTELEYYIPPGEKKIYTIKR